MRFKKILLTCFTLLLVQSAVSQALLSSQPLELKKSDYYHQIMLGAEADYQELVVFAADKENLQLLRYNSVFFFTDSLTTQRPDTDYSFMAGYSFSAYKNGTVYWASNNLEKMEAVVFNFETGKTKEYYFDGLFEKEDILNYFSEENNFYVVTLPDKAKELKLYAFNGNRYEIHSIDLSGILFKNDKGKPLALEDFFYNYPPVKMQSSSFNPLAGTAAKTKLYTAKNQWVLATDYNPEFTHLFFIDTDNFSFTEKVISQPMLKDDAETNSFYLNGTLYQLALNKEELALQASHTETGELLQAYKVGRDDKITFKNSPLLKETPYRSPLEFKNTKKFLRQARLGDAALSVYRTPDDILVNAGCVRSVVPAGNVVAGVAISMAGADPAVMYETELHTLYFEGIFDDAFKHKSYNTGLLAIDYVSQFLSNTRNASMDSFMPFDYYYILGYYDIKEKRYVIRKFQDDFAY